MRTHVCRRHLRSIRFSRTLSITTSGHERASRSSIRTTLGSRWALWGRACTTASSEKGTSTRLCSCAVRRTWPRCRRRIKSSSMEARPKFRGDSARLSREGFGREAPARPSEHAPNPEAEGEPEQRHRAAHQREEAHVAGADRLADRNGHRVEGVRVPPRSARLSLEDLGHLFTETQV